MAKERSKHTPGFTDIELVLEHIDKKYKEHRRREWLKQYFSKKPNTRGEVKDENNTESSNRS